MRHLSDPPQRHAPSVHWACTDRVRSVNWTGDLARSGSFDPSTNQCLTSWTPMHHRRDHECPNQLDWSSDHQTLDHFHVASVSEEDGIGIGSVSRSSWRFGAVSADSLRAIRRAKIRRPAFSGSGLPDSGSARWLVGLLSINRMFLASGAGS